MEIQEFKEYQGIADLDVTLKVREFKEQIDILKALASDTRLKIIKILREKRNDPERGLDISSLAYLLKQTEANISAQCKRLEKAGLIKIEFKPGGHGVRKICSVDFASIEFLFE